VTTEQTWGTRRLAARQNGKATRQLRKALNQDAIVVVIVVVVAVAVSPLLLSGRLILSSRAAAEQWSGCSQLVG
jgi:hypothetical protein